VLDRLLVPRDPRGIVLLCGYVVSAAYGLGVILTVGDPIGYAYLALAVVGYFFIQTRGLTTFLWIIVSAAGAAVAVAGNSSGWIECALGLACAIVGLARLPVEYRSPPVGRALPVLGYPSVALANGSSPSPSIEVAPGVEDEIKVTRVSPVQLVAGMNGSRSWTKISIQTLGRLRVEVKGVDVAERLEPRLQFLLGYVLARRIAGVEAAVDRGVLAEEVAPDISSASQRDRLRKQLYDLQSNHPALGTLLHVDRGKVWLELGSVDWDAIALLSMASRVGADHVLVDTETAAQIAALLDRSRGEFLAGFEELAQQTTQARGSASEIVRSARLVVAQARADLALALADHHIAAGHAERGISQLELALEECPDRQDIARLLVAAYLQTGQIARARQARRDNDLVEEG
jgi:DNA-binding SARP family transcriptional activator